MFLFYTVFFLFIILESLMSNSQPHICRSTSWTSEQCLGNKPLSCPIVQIYLICILKELYLVILTKMTENSRSLSLLAETVKVNFCGALEFNQKLIANKSCLIKKKTCSFWYFDI